jgi:hypothetical protein
MLSKLSYLLKHCLKLPASNLDWNSSSFFRVSDKNDYGVVSDRLGLLKSLAMETGCHIMAVHHKSKSDKSLGDGALGSTAWTGVPDSVIELSGDRKNVFPRILQSFGRGGSHFVDCKLKFDSDTQVFSIMESDFIQSLIMTEEKIFKALEIGEQSKMQLFSLVGGSSKNFNLALKKLQEGNQILRNGEGKRGSSFTYKLA